MNFDYQHTQAELTYQLSSPGGWELKKVSRPGSTDLNAGLENANFQNQMAQMTEQGWALVSMAAIPGAVKQSAISLMPLSQTSSYDLFWKRPQRG